jgi:hypothetical protein
MRVDENPRFPADPGSLIRKLTDLFRQFGKALNDLLAWFGNTTTATNVTANATLGFGTTNVTATGKTLTLPSAATAGVGRELTVILTVAGWVAITCAGSDTVQVDGSQTSIRLDNDGASVTLRVLSLTTWGIV